MDLSTESSQHENTPSDVLSRWSLHHSDAERNVLVLNVLLLGGRQSGRSSVGNALIGGHEFQTGSSPFGVTTECRVLRRTFSSFFRRQGVESDMMLRVIDTPPQLPHSQSLHKLCPEGVHTLLIVVRADLPHENSHLLKHAERLLGPEWHHHAILILTHADHLKEVGLHPSAYLAQTPDWLRGLAEEAGGGVWFLDNTCDWPSISGQPLRDRILRLSAKNHHKALTVRTEGSL